jgi:hypothetical protein
MKNVIVAIWLDSGRIEVFSSLRGFTENYPQYNEHTINNYISRKKIPYVTDELSLVKTKFIRRKSSEEDENPITRITTNVRSTQLKSKAKENA